MTDIVSLTSFSFFVLFIMSLIIYYLIPKRYQWVALLIYSIVFFVLSCEAWTILYVIISIVSTKVVCNVISIHKDEWDRKKLKAWLLSGITVNLGILCLLKYLNFLISNIDNILSFLNRQEIPLVKWAAPVGISFYTLQIIAYMLDVYWEITEPEKGFIKTGLFIGYWPQLISGPVARHNEMKDQLYTEHNFSWKNLTFGVQRMLWGVFKSVVLSSRLKIMVDTIYDDTIRYNGFYIWLAAGMFMFQLYTDFSGCMDIVIGASECYGIVLPENFRTPFFSRSVQEYWQRWHMTLGGVMRDYVMNPILRSDTWRKMTKSIKARFGRKASVQVPSNLAMLVVWLLMGLWHGGDWKYILGMGMWFWGCIVLSRMLTPFSKKAVKVLRINTEVFSWHLFQSLWVFALVSIGNMFFRLVSFKETLKVMYRGFSHWNPWILFDGSLFKLGIGDKEFRVVVVGLLVLLIVSILQEKRGSVREIIARQNYVFRYLTYLLLVGAIIIFGTYGPGFDAQTFIYGNF